MSIEAHNIKRMRGHILGVLKSFYPNGISGRVILRDILAPVFPHIEWIEALQQIDYLSERGFVEVVKDIPLLRTPSARDQLYRLTAKGLDVATGVTQDATIEAEV